MSQKATRLLIVGIDAADYELTSSLIGAGRMPNLGRLVDRGQLLRLRSTINMSSASAWPSFATGLHPENHGIWDFTAPTPGHDRLTVFNATHRRGEAFWEVVSNSGATVLVAGIMMTYPVRPVNGIMIAGMLAPSPVSTGSGYPPDLVRELHSRFGNLVVYEDIRGAALRGDYAGALQRTLASAKRLGDLYVHLVREHQWQLAVLYFPQIDWIQHYLWHLSDPEHPRHDASTPPELRDTVPAMYEAVDGELGRLLDVSADANVMVMSDHGAGLAHQGAVYLRGLLEAMGLATYKRRAGWSALARRAARSLVPARLRAAAGRKLAVEGQLLYAKLLGDIDWPRTRAFTCRNGTVCGQIWINLKGRQPHGIVAAGPEYWGLVELLESELAAATDPATERSAVRRVTRRGLAMSPPGPVYEPDLLVQFAQGAVLGGLMVPSGAANTTPWRNEQERDEPLLRTGDHRPYGILAVGGAEFDGSTPVGEAEIVDVAPTALHLLSLGIPAQTQGRVLAELLAEPAHSRPPQFTEEAAAAGRTETPVAPSPQEEEEVIRRLDGLGYL